MYYRQLSDDEAETDDSGPKLTLSEGPEYSFEGFEIEFSEKVALLPAAAEKGNQRP
jgi:hypothetical protein